ncbi:GNAT family N-acetyltransferase [Fictibacillus barbaricus]|uniref:RimJ/RimL family protein N-acetyltransferase n=1 Tax=Fictibacillus barbaricus TaxID=182136 RepID=A0ABU1TYK4_9BACL|nr:GNAT family protein [Fictibacillus barbaricus]MDR7072279.1 RimJ/RimL family protein N-acetyltransferase [Fictibacillus barbaricus]
MKYGEVYTFRSKSDEDIILRPVNESDAEEIIKSVETIIKEGKYIQKEEPRSLLEEITFIKQVNTLNHMYTAVERAGKVVGIARILRGQLEMKRHTGVFRTWIHPDSQGLGIAKELMNYTLRWGKANSLHKLWLTVFSGNEKAAYVYSKVGFVIEGRLKDQVKINGKYEDEIYMSYFFPQ